MLASEYGWSKHDIFYDVYFDELYFLLQKIEKRKLIEYRMQLAITQNPHIKEPEKLWNVLNAPDRTERARSKEFDEKGFEALKSRLSSNPRFVVK